MIDLYAWLSQQHHGLWTFHTFQQELATLRAASGIDRAKRQSAGAEGNLLVQWMQMT